MNAHDRLGTCRGLSRRLGLMRALRALACLAIALGGLASCTPVLPPDYVMLVCDGTEAKDGDETSDIDDNCDAGGVPEVAGGARDVKSASLRDATKQGG